jgi:predicted phage tail protein
MSKPAFTLKIFGIYMNLLGISLMLAPNLMLSLFFITPTSEVWIRVAGVLVFNLGVYYWFAAKCEAEIFYQASVFARFFVLAAFTVFAALGFVSPVLIFFGAVDAAGGIWTWIALNSDESDSV